MDRLSDWQLQLLCQLLLGCQLRPSRDATGLQGVNDSYDGLVDVMVHSGAIDCATGCGKTGLTWMLLGYGQAAMKQPNRTATCYAIYNLTNEEQATNLIRCGLALRNIKLWWL